MDAIINSSLFLIIMMVVTIINLFLLLFYIYQSVKTKKAYDTFMKKLGKGENLDELMHGYINDVETLKEKCRKLDSRCTDTEKNLEKCIQKVGMIRYNPYGNTGSDLCFALTLLDFEDNGVVINGIYSRDNTTATYAKPIVKGKSKYTLTKEEQESLNIAQNSGYKYYLNVEK